NSSGWAQYSFIEPTIGNYNITCNTSNDASNFFYATPFSESTRQLFVRANNTDITIPTITNVTSNPSLFSVGGVTTISANVIDDVLVDQVFVYIRFPNTTLVSFPMTLVGGNIYEYDFTQTTQDGNYEYYVYALDNTSNPAYSSIKNFETVGVRSFIGIQSQQNIFKLGEDLNLTPFTKTEDIDPSIYSEVGDVNYIFYSFDSSDEGWTHSGTQDEWERGVPTDSDLNTCDSGNCWATDLDNNYNNNANNNIRSPVLDMSGRSNTIINFWREIRYQNPTADNIFLESFDGSAWNSIYQNTIGAVDQEGAFYTYYPSEVDDVSNAQFRFRVLTNGAGVQEGFVFDSFNISFNPREDWDKDWNYITSSFGSDVTKVTAIKVGINITNYDASGSNSNSNSQPDIEVQIYNGTGYSTSRFCNLDDTKTYPYYCDFVVKNIDEYMDSWANSVNRNIRFRVVDIDQGDTISFTDIKREYVTPSIVENNGIGQMSAYLLQQFRNSSGGVVSTLYFNPISINPGESIQLGDFWNYSIAGNFQLGNYTAYVALTDASGNILQNEDDGSFINDSYAFTIQSLIINYLNPSEILNNTESFRINITLDTSSYGFGGWCGYSLNGAANVSMSNPSLNYLEAFVNDFPDGNHQIEIFCDDSDGDIVTSGVRDFVVSEPPRINFVVPTPANNSIHPTSIFDVNVSVDDATFDSAWLEFEGENLPLSCTFDLGISYYCNGSAGIKNGIYSYRVCANDSLDNINCTETRTIQINAPLPVLTLLSPLNNSKIFLGDELNITLDSTLPLDSVWYSIAGIVINDTLSPLSSTLWDGYRNLTTGRYDLYVEVNDSFDNRVNLSHVFYVLPDKHVRVSKSIILPGNNSIVVNSTVENFGFWQNYTYAELLPSPFTRISASTPEDFSEVIGLDTLYYYDLSLPINSTFTLQSNYQRTLLGNAGDFFSVFVD
ncbi:MAG: hypothetical protein VXZ40_00400, partial [Nanoarchaeota archaeon]|nr:hypothetical protein [Nanoarchaeota archaeon]